jgi:hypothetical protein
MEIAKGMAVQLSRQAMHKYHVGQAVHFERLKFPRRISSSSRMPLRAGESEYRIKSPREEHERGGGIEFRS